MRFSANQFARRAFEKEEALVHGEPVTVEPCAKEWQAKGFQGFLAAPLIKILTAALKEAVPGGYALYACDI